MGCTDNEIRGNPPQLSTHLNSQPTSTLNPPQLSTHLNSQPTSTLNPPQLPTHNIIRSHNSTQYPYSKYKITMRNLIQSLWGTGFSPAQTPSPSAPSATSASSATHTSTRDRDLISSDELLTDDALDELWAWFCGAAKDGTDLQLVFVKLINSVSSYLTFTQDLHSSECGPCIPC